MDKFYQRINRLLKLSHNEARGFVSLLIISVVALILLFIPEIITRQNISVDPADVKRLDSLVALLERDEPFDENQTLFSFNPNVISVDSLVRLGFPNSVAKRLVNYRSKGGRFFIKQDVKKIYGVTDKLMEDIYSFINLPERALRIHEKKSSKKIDLNSASAEQFKTITMIGDVFAARIVKYRNSLGGFVSKNQLEEVYGLSDDALNNLKSDTFITSGFRPRRIKINHDSLEVLQNHPYISDHLAEDILRFRNLNDAIESEKVLVNFKSVEKSKFEKLILYLDFQ